MKAVVFVDVQNDFVKGGKLAFGYPVEDNVHNVIAFARQCREKGYMLYATVDTHSPTVTQDPTINNYKEYGYLHTLEGKKLPVEHCIRGTEGHKIVNGLVKDEDRNVIIPQGHIIDKPTFGSFDLLARIDQDFVVDSYGHTSRQSKHDGIGEKLDEIIICGYCTSICVASNAIMLRAKYPNVKITVRADLCGDVDEESHKAALKVLQMQQIDIEGI